MATIASWERIDPAESQVIVRRARAYLTDLRASPEAEWYPEVLRAAALKLWPAADALTSDLVLRHLAALERHNDKASFIKEIQLKTRDLARDEKYSAGLRQSWNDGRQLFGKLAVELYAQDFDFSEMWAELRAYLDEYGVEGKYGTALLASALETLNSAYENKISFDQRVTPTRPWLESWHGRLEKNGSSKASERLNVAWTNYVKRAEVPLPIGKVSLSDLEFDPRLHVTFTGEFRHPSLGMLLDRMSEQTGMSFKEISTSPPLDEAAASIRFDGPMFRAMKQIAELPNAQGEWVRTSDGYILQASWRPSPVEKVYNLSSRGYGRMLLIFTNLVCASLLITWFLRGRSKR
jgi:hypothetical protein